MMVMNDDGGSGRVGKGKRMKRRLGSLLLSSNQRAKRALWFLLGIKI
jgi:hypothetical protein